MSVAEIEVALNVLFEPGSVVELRAPGTSRGTKSGYFSDFSALTMCAAQLSDKVPGVYATINPVLGSLLARAQNRVIEFAKHTSNDSDIVRRCWLPIDFDPVRPAGISSTEEEHQSAIQRAISCRRWLAGQGWPQPILADSGNGAHLLCRVELPNDEMSRQLVKGCLEALAFRFTDAAVVVDLSTYNSARLWKVYGTVAAKGDSTLDRPHRVAQLLDFLPENAVVASLLLQRLAAAVPVVSSTNQHGAPNFDVSRWLQSHDLRVVTEGPWRTGYKWVLESCPWNGEHRNRSAFVLQFPNGAIGAGCLHQSCAQENWQSLRSIFEPHRTSGPQPNIHGGQPSTREEPCLHYRSTPSGLVWLKETKDGLCPVQLSNFDAHITTDIEEDDGIEVRRTLEITATLGPRSCCFKVPSTDFGAMVWPLQHLGAEAVIFPGSGIRDHARAAVQLLSANVQHRTIYGHLGWRRIDGSWVYLHRGGGIGATGNVERIEVSLPNALQFFHLPNPPTGQELIDAWRSDLLLLDIAPDTASVGWFLAIWRAAIAGADFSVHLTGPTGTFKSELAAIAMQHFGSGFGARNLPASWSSTGNSLEVLAFVAKDSLLVVDDFAPSGSIADVQRYHREAERLLRAQRNNAGRHRLRPDSSLRSSKSPRGLIMSTGEDTPKGQSLRAGILVLEVGPNDVDQRQLTRAQANAAGGIFAKTMSGFLQWAAARYEAIGHHLRTSLTDVRLRAIASTSHRRTPEIVANLAVGMEFFLDFGIDIGAVTAIEAGRIRERCWAALGDIAAAQASHLASSEPTQRFLELLVTAIGSGRAHIADPEGYEPQNSQAWGWRTVRIGATFENHAHGHRVGWVDNDSLFLDLDAAFAAAQNIGRELGDNISVTPRTLSKRLHEKGLLLKTSANSRQTFKVRHTLEGRRREVIQMSADVFGRYLRTETDHEQYAECPSNGERTSGSDAWSGVSSKPTKESTSVSSFHQAVSTSVVGLGRSNTDEESNVHSGTREPSLSCEAQLSVTPRDPTTNLTTAGDAEVSREELV